MGRSNKSVTMPLVPALILTKPTKGAAGTKKKEKLAVSGLEEIAAKLRKRNEQIESLNAENEVDKAQVIEVCRKERRDAEVAGDFHSTLLVESADEKPIQVVFVNKFSKVDVAHAPALKTALNGQFDTLFRRGIEIKTKDSVDLAKLTAVLGDKLDAFLALAEVTEYLSLDRDFMEKRAALRPALDPATNVTIDQISDQCQQKPMIKTK